MWLRFCAPKKGDERIKGDEFVGDERIKRRRQKKHPFKV